MGLHTEPGDAIDPYMLDALRRAHGRVLGDFTLDGEVMEVDLLGSSATRSAPGPATSGGVGTEYRVMTSRLPLIVNDLWDQEA
jgi:hypothetical protein